MRLLIVNPNTSPGVTARIAQAAQACAMPGDRFTTVSAAFGPALIVTEADAHQATAGVVQAVADHTDAVDGIVLASFGDTGADEVRARWADLPVIGIAQAAFARARALDAPFSIVTFAPEVAAPLVAKAKEHGVQGLLLAVHHPTAPLQHDPADAAEALQDTLLALCLRAAREGAHSVVFGGGPLAGLASRLQPLCPVPLIDGTAEAIAALRLATDMPAHARP